MKKIISLILIFSSIFVFTSCSSYDENHKYFDAKGFVQEYHSEEKMKTVLEKDGFEVEIDKSSASLEIYSLIFKSQIGREYKFKAVLTAEKITDEKHVYFEVYFLNGVAGLNDFLEFGESLYVSHDYSFSETDDGIVIMGYVDLYENSEDNTENGGATTSYEDHLNYH